MPDNRRSASRTRPSGLHATFEGADGVVRQGDVFDLSRTGLFLEVEDPVPVGKRLSLEVHGRGQPAPWLALGRVVWTRPADQGSERPRGMGVKLIDVDDTAIDGIERLFEDHERTSPGLGQEALRAYEKTILGVGTAKVIETPAATVSEPLVTALVTPLVPSPLAPPTTPPRPLPPGEDGEPGIAIDLVQRATPAPRPRARNKWIVAGVVAVALAIAAYAFRGYLHAG